MKNWWVELWGWPVPLEQGTTPELVAAFPEGHDPEGAKAAAEAMADSVYAYYARLEARRVERLS